jgi:acyl-CoA thioesterase-1
MPHPSASLRPTRRPWRAFSPAWAVLALLALAACGGGAAPDSSTPAASGSSTPDSSTPSPALSAPSTAGEAGPPRVVFLGDSLTAGYGLGEEQAFPALLEERFAARGLPIRVVNAGVSGDTSAGGLARLDWVLAARPDVLVVELGANDGLRGLDLAATEANLRRIVEGGRAAGARVLLVGMRIPPNYGAEYAGAFEALFPRLAEELDVPLVPFLLAGVGGEPELNQADGIHPNAAGHRKVAAVVEPYLEPLVRAAANQSSPEG